MPVIHNLEPPPTADGDNTNDETWAASRDLGSAKLTVVAEDLEAFYDYARVFAAFLHSHHHHEVQPPLGFWCLCTVLRTHLARFTGRDYFHLGQQEVPILDDH